MRSKCQGGDANLGSCHTINSSSDDTTVTGDADSDFTTVRNYKFSRRVKNDLKVIDTYNMFEEFNKPEFQVAEPNDQDVLVEEEISEMYAIQSQN